MRVYQALRSTLVWSLQATARHHSKLTSPPIVATTRFNKLSSVPQMVSHSLKAEKLGSSLIRQSPFATIRRHSTGRVLLELRAGASSNLGGIMTSFRNGIEASKTKSWLLLILCICNETAAVTLIKKATESSNPRLMAIAICLYVGTLFGFAISLAQIDVSIAYAVWSALGTAIVSVAGILLFNESHSWKKMVCLACIMVGVVGLNLLDDH